MYVARMRVSCDGNLHVTSRLQDVFQHLENQAGHHIRGISTVKIAIMKVEYVLLAQLERSDDVECTMETVSRVRMDAPVLVTKKLRRVRPPAAMRTALKHRYNTRVMWKFGCAFSVASR